MKVVIGSDHAGYSYRELLAATLRDRGYEVTSMGAQNGRDADDYPDRAAEVVTALQDGRGDRGIIICGSAVGVSVAANKYKGIRAGVCHDTYSAHQSVEHDNANVLCIGERVIGIELAREIMLTFLNATFSGEERHIRRLEKIAETEHKTMK